MGVYNFNFNTTGVQFFGFLPQNCITEEMVNNKKNTYDVLKLHKQAWDLYDELKRVPRGSDEYLKIVDELKKLYQKMYVFLNHSYYEMVLTQFYYDILKNNPFNPNNVICGEDIVKRTVSKCKNKKILVTTSRVLYEGNRAYIDIINEDFTNANRKQNTKKFANLFDRTSMSDLDMQDKLFKLFIVCGYSFDYIKDIFISQDVEKMVEVSYWRTLFLKDGESIRAIENKTGSEIIDKLNEDYNKSMQLLSEFIVYYFEYVDFDKLMLSIARCLYTSLEENGCDKSGYNIAYAMLCKVENAVDNKARYRYLSEKKIGKRDINFYKRKFVGGEYLSEKRINEIREGILSSAILLEDVNEDVLRNIHLTRENKIEIASKSPSNLRTLLEMNFLSNLEIKSALDNFNKEQISELIPYLKSKGILTDFEFWNLYLNGKIDFLPLEENEIEFEQFLQDENLVNYYINCSKQLDNSDLIAEKNRFISVYRKYILKDLSEDKRVEKLEWLAMLVYDKIDKEEQEQEDKIQMLIEAMTMMYEDGVADFNSLSIDATVFSEIVINRLLKKGKLSLSDTQKIKDALNYEQIDKFLSIVYDDKTVSEDQKFTLLFNLCHDDGDVEDDIRKRYLDQLMYHKGKFKGNNRKVNGNGTQEPYQKYIYPVHRRWMLFHRLDKDCRAKKYENGFVEFLLPKFDIAFIEKYFEVSSDGSIIGDAYGNSTCALTTIQYGNNGHLFIVPKKDTNGNTIFLMNDYILRQMVDKKDRIRHNTQSHARNWMRSIVSYLGVDLENYEIMKTVYTKEEFEELTRFVKENENEYIML